MEEKRQESVPVLLKAALAYARRGVPVFPCEPGAKRPLTQNGHWDATTDTRVIERWWKGWPSANVGVLTGKKSGVVVLDVDVDDGGLESLAKLERAGAPIPKTARVRTGGGGIHVFFRNPRGTEIRNSAGLLGPGLDVRGAGGYVVVPLSRTQLEGGRSDRLSSRPIPTLTPVERREVLRDHPRSPSEKYQSDSRALPTRSGVMFP